MYLLYASRGQSQEPLPLLDKSRIVSEQGRVRRPVHVTAHLLARSSNPSSRPLKYSELRSKPAKWS